MKPPTSEAMARLFDKLPPHAPEAEIALLGSMIHDGRVIGEVTQVLHGASDFYDQKHAAIYQILLRLDDHSLNIDLVQLKQQLADKGLLEQIGDIEYLVELCESVPSAASVAYYAKMVREKAQLRAFSELCGKGLFDIHHKATDPAALMDQFEANVFEVCKTEDTRPSYTLDEMNQELLARLESGVAASGLRTGFVDLDKIIRAMRAANMIVIAGRPSLGKTALATNIADYLAVECRTPVAFFSLEMSRRQLHNRIIAGRSGINSQRLDEGDLSSEAIGKVAAAAKQINGAPLHVIDKGGLTVAELRARTRRLVSQHDVQLIVVDYLQLLTTPGQSRYEKVTNASNGIKALAGQLEVPIIAVSQLNRAADGRQDHRPRLSDLRESGAIEQDADLVLLLHREAHYHIHDPEWQANPAKLNTAEVVVAKNRNGAVGKVDLVFDQELTKFENVARESNEDGY